MTQRSFWDKNEEKRWTTEPWPRHRWPRRSFGEVSSRRRGQCGLTEARQPQPTWRRWSREAGGALGEVARPEVPRTERASSPKQQRRRGEDDERERERARGEMALSTRPGASWRPRGHDGSWQAGPTMMYRRHGSKHAASPASSSPLTLPPFRNWTRLKLVLWLRLTPKPINDFCWLIAPCCRATWGLQLWLQDLDLIRPGFQTGSYPNHPRANWCTPRLRNISKCWKQPQICLVGHLWARFDHFHEMAIKQLLFLIKFATTFL